MASYRIIHASPADRFRRLQLPENLYRNDVPGFTPTAAVFYMGLRVVLLPITIFNEIPAQATSYLVNLLGRDRVAYVEFESRSNTDIIVRTYDMCGEEMNAQQRRTHSTVHFLKRITRLRQRVHLSVPSNFGGTKTEFGSGDYYNVINPYTENQCLVPIRSHSCRFGGRYFVQGDEWTACCEKHGIEPGCIVVFGARDDLFKNLKTMDMSIYGIDGHEMLHVRPEGGFSRRAYNFYRKLNEAAYVDQATGIRRLTLHNNIANRAISLENDQTLEIRTIGQIIPVQFMGPIALNLSGDWNTIQWRDPEPCVKFKLSAVLNHLPDHRPIYAIEFLRRGRGDWPEDLPPQPEHIAAAIQAESEDDSDWSEQSEEDEYFDSEDFDSDVVESFDVLSEQSKYNVTDMESDANDSDAC